MNSFLWSGFLSILLDNKWPYQLSVSSYLYMDIFITPIHSTYKSFVETNEKKRMWMDKWACIGLSFYFVRLKWRLCSSEVNFNTWRSVSLRIYLNTLYSSINVLWAHILTILAYRFGRRQYIYIHTQHVARKHTTSYNTSVIQNKNKNKMKKKKKAH